MYTVNPKKSTAQSKVRLPLYQLLPITSLGTFMSALDGSILNVSLFTIQQALNTDKVGIRWVVVSYLLVLSALMGLSGSLGDAFGRKKLFMFGLGAFVLGSAFCAFSSTLEILVISRILQAIGGSGLIANGLAIVMTYAHPEHRGRAIGINSFVVASALTTGPVLGGILTETLGWPFIFLINIPVGLLAIVLTFRYIPETTIKPLSKFDYKGTIYFALMAFGVIGGIIIFFEGELWSLPVFIIGLVFFGIFIHHEYYCENPMLPLDLITKKKIATGLSSSVLSYMAVNGSFFLLPFFYQEIYEFSPSEAGLLMIVSPLIMSTTGPIAGFLAEKIEARKLATLGAFLQASFLFLLSKINQRMDLIIIVVFVALAAGSLAIFTNSNGTSVMNATPQEYLSITSGLLNLSRTMAFSIATGISISLFDFFFLSKNPNNIQTGEIFVSAYYQGLGQTLFIMSAFAFIGGLISILRGSESSSDKLGKTR